MALPYLGWFRANEIPVPSSCVILLTQMILQLNILGMHSLNSAHLPSLLPVSPPGQGSGMAAGCCCFFQTELSSVKAKGKLILKVRTLNPRALYWEEQGHGHSSWHQLTFRMVFSPIHFQFNLNPCLGKGDSDSVGCQEVILAGNLFLLASAQFNCHCSGGSPETLLYNLSVISLFLKPQQNPEVLAKQGSPPVPTSSIPKASALCRTWPLHLLRGK